MIGRAVTRKPRTMNGFREKSVPYLFLLPFIISYLIFFVYPAGFSLLLSFQKYKGYGTAKWVGFKNYANLINYKTMWMCLGNTVYYFISSFIPVMIISFLLAVCLRSKPMRKYQRIYKPLIFMPQICATVAASLIFKIIFGDRVGILNQLFGTDIHWLSDMHLMKYPVTVLITWRAVAWYFIIYISGLTTINDEVIESATMDGANAWQRLIHIIIPLMKPIFMLTFITYSINSFKLYSEPSLLLGSNNAECPIQVAPYISLVVNNVKGGNFGMAAAAGWFLVLIILALTLIQMKFFRKDDA